ncbi:sulfatase-like hydrolase/transferase [Archangium lansingense]|uniref:sulfatase-like hydrolase/transferase n=1 Tax=Archangium lansingense TaxID=2995310 RepID=UPI00280BC196|nr:sulfatase-like hydrolase/transferase [Archangium lansinium]
MVLLDDVGFGASSAFGGVINTPAAERLAKGGLKYNRFHTTALCSPTRAALLTGRNPHAAAKVSKDSTGALAPVRPPKKQKAPGSGEPGALKSGGGGNRTGEIPL